MRRISVARLGAAAFLFSCLQVAATPVQAGATERFVLDGLQAARSQSGSSELQHRSDLDEVAEKQAGEIARRAHSKRLLFDESIEEILRRSGVADVQRAILHVDLKRGYRHPGAAFLDGWKEYESAWRIAMSETLDSVGLAVRQADDGRVVLVAILLEELEPLRHESADLRVLERQTVAAVNDARRSSGLEELVSDPALARVARAHSEEMASRGYFAHRSPDGHEVDERVRRAGIVYRRVGENLHRSRKVEKPVPTAVESWMSSRRHRETMLSSGYTRTAVGVAVDEDGELYFTQLFLLPAE